MSASIPLVAPAGIDSDAVNTTAQPQPSRGANNRRGQRGGGGRGVGPQPPVPVTTGSFIDPSIVQMSGQQPPFPPAGPPMAPFVGVPIPFTAPAPHQLHHQHQHLHHHAGQHLGGGIRIPHAHHHHHAMLHHHGHAFQHQSHFAHHQHQMPPHHNVHNRRGGRGGGSGQQYPSQRGGIHIPLPAPAPAQSDTTQLASALPPPPPPEKKIDQLLLKQLRDRYALQNEHEHINKHDIVGLLDVDECLKVVEAHDVTFVVTDTGTGKSSLIPDALIKVDGNKVANSQPRRTAAVNLAHRVAVDLRHEKVGENVGYWVRGEHCGDIPTCKLMYMTSYTLLLYLLGHPDTLPFTHIIIDEFHERQPDVEVMLGLLKLALISRRNKASSDPDKKMFKVILMSASVELEMWRAYFTGLDVGEYTTCKARYAVHEYYREEVCRLIDRAPNVEPTLSPIVSSLQLKNVELFVEEMLTLLAELADPQDSILVFLPGRTIVENMANFVEKRLSKQLEAIPWYRDIDLTTIQAALQRPATTRKKVYLATDIAEVSLTLPDVVFVVDSGMTKKPRIDISDRNSVAFPPLELMWCSKSALIQRRGRVGRVQQGFFFSMIPEAHKQDLVEMEPQIANATIHELVLHSLQISNSPINVFNLCRVTPKTVSVMLSLNVLLDGGFIAFETSPLSAEERVDSDESKAWRDVIAAAKENDQNGDADRYITTCRGKISQHLPLPLEASSMVFIGGLFGLETLMSIAASIVACGSPFYVYHEDRTARPSAKQKSIDALSVEMKQYSFGLPSDIVAALHIVLLYMNTCRAEGLTSLAEENWCDAHSVKKSRILDILRLDLQTREQYAAQVPFAHEADPTVLLEQLKKYAPLVSMLAAASHLERALFVQYSAADAQRNRKVGPSLVLGVSANRDQSVSTCCPWQRDNIVIPLSIQTRYNNLLGSFATQLSQHSFNMLLLLMVTRVVFEVREASDDRPAVVLFGVELHGQKQAFATDKLTGSDILTFRQIVSAKYCAMRTQMDLVGADPLDERILPAIREKGIQCVPAAIKDQTGIAALVRFLFDKIMADPESGRFCRPCNEELRPQEQSIIASSCSGRTKYVAQQSLPFHVPLPPPPPPQGGDDGNAAAPVTPVFASPLSPAPPGLE